MPRLLSPVENECQYIDNHIDGIRCFGKLYYSPFFVSSTLTQRFPSYWARALLRFCSENSGRSLQPGFHELGMQTCDMKSLQKIRVYVVRMRRQIAKPDITVGQSQCAISKGSTCATRMFVAFIQHSECCIFVVLQSYSVGDGSYYISGVSHAKP